MNERLASQDTINELETEVLIDKIVQTACHENPKLQEISQDELKEVAQTAQNEMRKLEEVAKNPLEHLPKTTEEAKRCKVIWDLSGPGTYNLPSKNDRYQDSPWAKWMDHKRLNRSAWLMRKLTEIITNRKFNIDKGQPIKHIDELRNAILNHGPKLIYNGREDENAVVEDVLTRTGIAIPPEKVFVSGKTINTSVDQVKQFQLPPEVSLDKDDQIIIVSNAPHLVRVMRMINQYRPFAEGTKVKLFPLPTPKEGLREYTEQEIKGILYYTFISGDSTKESYPYKV